jgi:GGDEF domain-containing protein
LISTLLHALRPVAAPAAILLTASLAIAAGPKLPPSLAGLTSLGPYVVLLLGAAISVWFNRGRAFIALASLLIAYASYSLVLDWLGADSFAAQAVFTALAMLVPANILLALVFRERGVSQHHNYRWLILAAAEILSVAWIASAGRSPLSGTAWRDVLDHWLLKAPPMPLAGRLMFAAAFIAAVASAWPKSPSTQLRPLETGLAGALAAFFIACEWVSSPGVFGAFMTAAGIVLLVSVLQESHRLAFRDELTGLPSRRALEERLRGLGPVYAIAMVDVDHFKQFNDTHGHDIGGTAYRYGGEEFAVLFPGRSLIEAISHLEKLRRDIETYRMAVRKADRPKDPETGTKQRITRAPDHTLSVTVSIGAAERSERDPIPALVVRSADEALYRAKHAGRNRLSR